MLKLFTQVEGIETKQNILNVSNLNWKVKPVIICCSDVTSNDLDIIPSGIVNSLCNFHFDYDSYRKYVTFMEF